MASKRVFQQHISFYAEMLAAFQVIRDETVTRLQVENRRLVHNLTTLNTHILQEIYNITPQEKLTGNPNGQIWAIRDALIREPERAARAALRILKNAVAARTEMQIARRLQPSEPNAPLNPKAHVIHRVVTNALITFFQDSQERNLTWLLGPSSQKVIFDYESVSAALYRLFENAVKYCKPHTEIRISFSSDPSHLEMAMEMTSLWISNEENEEIFREGYSGRVAVDYGLSGDGLGLYFVREMLKLNSALIRYEPVTQGNPLVADKYGNNRFIISFPPGSSGGPPLREVTAIGRGPRASPRRRI